jgi:hypothetical protein
VDRVEGDRIKLTKNDPEAQDQHRYISIDKVASVEENAALFNKSPYAHRLNYPILKMTGGC